MKSHSIQVQFPTDAEIPMVFHSHPIPFDFKETGRGRFLGPPSQGFWDMMHWIHLVGGFSPSPLKNDGVSSSVMI